MDASQPASFSFSEAPSLPAATAAHRRMDTPATGGAAAAASGDGNLTYIPFPTTSATNTPLPQQWVVFEAGSDDDDDDDGDYEFAEEEKDEHCEEGGDDGNGEHQQQQRQKQSQPTPTSCCSRRSGSGGESHHQQHINCDVHHNAVDGGVLVTPAPPPSVQTCVGGGGDDDVNASPPLAAADDEAFDGWYGEEEEGEEEGYDEEDGDYLDDEEDGEYDDEDEDDEWVLEEILGRRVDKSHKHNSDYDYDDSTAQPFEYLCQWARRSGRQQHTSHTSVTATATGGGAIGGGDNGSTAAAGPAATMATVRRWEQRVYLEDEGFKPIIDAYDTAKAKFNEKGRANNNNKRRNAAASAVADYDGPDDSVGADGKPPRYRRPAHTSGEKWFIWEKQLMDDAHNLNALEALLAASPTPSTTTATSKSGSHHHHNQALSHKPFLKLLFDHFAMNECILESYCSVLMRHTYDKFLAKWSALRDTHRPVILFHGTSPHNISSIVAKGLLVPGEVYVGPRDEGDAKSTAAANKSKGAAAAADAAAKEDGARRGFSVGVSNGAAHGKGIYTAPLANLDLAMNYSPRNYTEFKEDTPGYTRSRSELFLCVGLVAKGDSKNVKILKRNPLGTGRVEVYLNSLGVKTSRAARAREEERIGTMGGAMAASSLHVSEVNYATAAAAAPPSSSHPHPPHPPHPPPNPSHSHSLVQKTARAVIFFDSSYVVPLWLLRYQHVPLDTLYYPRDNPSFDHLRWDLAEVPDNEGGGMGGRRGRSSSSSYYASGGGAPQCASSSSLPASATCTAILGPCGRRVQHPNHHPRTAPSEHATTMGSRRRMLASSRRVYTYHNIYRSRFVNRFGCGAAARSNNTNADIHVVYPCLPIPNLRPHKRSGGTTVGGNGGDADALARELLAAAGRISVGDATVGAAAARRARRRRRGELGGSQSSDDDADDGDESADVATDPLSSPLTAPTAPPPPLPLSPAYKVGGGSSGSSKGIGLTKRLMRQCPREVKEAYRKGQLHGTK